MLTAPISEPCLLTFFFRQMPELIRRGHLFIGAAAALQSVARQIRTISCSMTSELEDYLYREGLIDGALVLDDGEAIAGDDLADIIAKARVADEAISSLPARFSRDVIVQAAIIGAIREAGDDAEAVAAKVAERLNMISEEFERGWTGAPDGEGGYVFEREVRGVADRRPLPRDVLLSADARRVQETMQPLSRLFEKPATWTRKDQRQTVFGPGRLLSAIRAAGEKGISVQRYKGWAR